MNQHLDNELDAAPARERAAALARLPELLASPTLRILSVATTGLRQAHPVQIVVLDGDGRTLLDTLVHTDHPIEPGAQALHGVFVAHLNGCPPRTTHPDEAELIALIERLGPATLPNSRAVWYEHFPSPTIEEWRERALKADQ